MKESIVSTGSARTVEPVSKAREAYEDGMPLSVLRRRFRLSESEAQDIAPEEVERVEGNPVSGY